MATNKIQEKIEALNKERAELAQFMEDLNRRFTSARERVIQIDGAISALSEMFQDDGETNEISRVGGDQPNDTKGKTKSRSNSNKG